MKKLLFVLASASAFFFILSTPAFADTTISSNITSSTTWTTAGGTYIIDGIISLDSGVVINVDPSVVVKFKTDVSRIDVYGTLNVQGTSTAKVYFTSYKDDAVGGDTNSNGSADSPAASDWDTIKVESGGSATFVHAVVRYNWVGLYNQQGILSLNYTEVATSSHDGVIGGGSGTGTTTVTNSEIHHHVTGLSLNSTTTIATTTIRDNSAYGISSTARALTIGTSTFLRNTSGAANISLDNLRLFDNRGSSGSGNGLNGFRISGTLDANLTLATSGLPYIIPSDDVTVPSGKKLTIGTGVIVKFQDTDALLSISGELTAYSPDSDSPIIFTSLKNDKAGGDTNNDGAGTSPAAGDWDTIKIETDGVATLTHASSSYAYIGIYNYNGTLTINNSEIASSSASGYGILSQSGTTVVLASEVHHNRYGLANGSMSYVSINSSHIHDNTEGIRNYVLNTINAQYNYWGAADGPSGSGPGSGDSVSDDVDYSSWLDAAHYINVVNGAVVTSVDGSGYIDWDWDNGSSTAFTVPWYSAVDIWNAKGGVNIATDTVFSLVDLEIEDITSTSSSDWFAAQYDRAPSPDKIRFNAYYMNQSSASEQKNAALHELGHALGLYHSYLGNLMNDFITSQTTLGTQDDLDYDYLW